MILIINSENRTLFDADLRTMHRHRKTVFIDQLGWKIPAKDDEESDQYDREDTIYLIAREDWCEEPLASARLLPTTSAHLLSDHFSHLCFGPIPRGPGVWEASRFCANPAIVSRRKRISLLWEIIGAIMETALLFSINRVTFTANSALLPIAMSCGWRATVLGPTQPDGDDQVTAVSAAVTTEGLRRVKARLRTAGPLIRFVTPARRIAA